MLRMDAPFLATTFDMSSYQTYDSPEEREQKKGINLHIRTTGNDPTFTRTTTVMSRMRNF